MYAVGDRIRYIGGYPDRYGQLGTVVSLSHYDAVGAAWDDGFKKCRMPIFNNIEHADNEQPEDWS